MFKSLVKVYSYDQTTGIFAGDEFAEKIGIDTIMPAHSTSIKPPSTNKGELAVWSGDTWVVKQDRTGEKYLLPNGKIVRLAATQEPHSNWGKISDDAHRLLEGGAAEYEIAEGIAKVWLRPLSYAEKRLNEYPEFGEQLDMIFHDFEAWKTKIAEIKAKYPKE